MTAPVLPDANILFSRTLRDWLFLLSAEGALYKVFTTEDILAETVARYRDAKPEISGGQITRLSDALRGHVHGIIGDYSGGACSFIEDSGDWHVHHAAVSGKVMYLVANDKGFLELPENAKDELPYEIHSADSFFCLVDDSMPEITRKVALEQQEYWGKKTIAGRTRTLAEALCASGCPNFAEIVSRRLCEDLSIPVSLNRQIVALGT